MVKKLVNDMRIEISDTQKDGRGRKALATALVDKVRVLSERRHISPSTRKT